MKIKAKADPKGVEKDHVSKIAVITSEVQNKSEIVKVERVRILALMTTELDQVFQANFIMGGLDSEGVFHPNPAHRPALFSVNQQQEPEWWETHIAGRWDFDFEEVLRWIHDAGAVERAGRDLWGIPDIQSYYDGEEPAGTGVSSSSIREDSWSDSSVVDSVSSSSGERNSSSFRKIEMIAGSLIGSLEVRASRRRPRPRPVGRTQRTLVLECRSSSNHPSTRKRKRRMENDRDHVTPEGRSRHSGRHQDIRDRLNDQWKRKEWRETMTGFYGWLVAALVFFGVWSLRDATFTENKRGRFTFSSESRSSSSDGLFRDLSSRR